MSAIPHEMSCRELVELVTDYFEDALATEERLRFELHVTACEHCSNYLTQMRESIRVTGSLREDDIPADVQDELLRAFREWKRR
jgi:anti-sigma factor RsiW